jgi:sensor histidine kinase YesM
MKKDRTPNLQYFKKFNLTIVTAAALVVAIVAYFVYEMAISDLEKDEIKLEISLKEKIQNIDNLFNSLARQVEIMESEAENYYSNPDDFAYIKRRLQYQYLKQYDDSHYSTETLPLQFQESTSSIHGKGSIMTKLKDSVFVLDLGMQFRLGSLFGSIKKQFPDITWAYSISENDYINLFPFSSSNLFKYESNYREYEFYTLCVPKNNPDKRLKVSSAYMDAGGSGLMITISKPFYSGDRFAGVVAIDVTLATLKKYVESFSQAQNSQMIVVNDYGQVLANSYMDITNKDSTVTKFNDIIPGLKLPVAKDSTFTLKDSRVVRVVNFSDLPWKVVCISPESNWLLSREGKVYIGFMLGLALLLTLVLVFIQRNFINPSMQLVSYIENQSKNILTVPHIHSSWKQWFDVVKVAFELSRKAIFTLEENGALQKQISETQIRALQAQMNPHFIFNCLNSINHFILDSKPFEASDYLARFSKMIRLFMEELNEDYVLLSKQRKILELYLELEKIRFERRLVYEINIDPAINADRIYIPSMIIHSFIENSIVHGIQLLNSVGRISVLFVRENDNLKCIVEDNGIGRVKSLQTNKPVLEKKSMGISLSAQRLKSLQPSSSIEILDLKDEANKPSGTRVLITFSNAFAQIPAELYSLE